MSQLRLNPLSGRWVTIVSSRAERPSDFAPRIAQVESDPSRPCPFCPGNEDATAPPIATYGPADRWLVRVVPNLYPAYYGDEPLAVTTHSAIFTQAPASGRHEVMVLSPQHDGSWATLDDEGCAAVMAALRDRLAEHAAVPFFRYTQAIVNHGREAGASLSHPHAQILVLPIVPRAILEEEAGFDRFAGGCLLCATVEAEVAADHRVVYADERVVVVCPFWAGEPFELLVIPRTCSPHLHAAASDDLAAAGVGIRYGLRRIQERVGDVAHNIVFHSAPYHHVQGFHWHAHVWPKLATQAGFERGTGVLINIVAPEVAADRLR